jgi:hypothetical protein
MKIGAVCITYLRPKRLGHLIWCFQQQTHENRVLVILDDAGQYDDTEGDRWRLVSRSERFPTLGDKRNAATKLLPDDVEAVAVWDDDDLYLPHALAASANALQDADWSCPSLVLHPTEDGKMQMHLTGGLFHGGWAYRREMFDRVGGYPAIDNGEDQGLLARLKRAGAKIADPLLMRENVPAIKPFYVFPWEYNWTSDGPHHISGAGPNGYRNRGAMLAEKAEVVPTEPPIDLMTPDILPIIFPRKF